MNNVKIDGKIVGISKPIGKEGNKYYFIKIKQSRVFNEEKHSTFFDVKVYSNILKKHKELFLVDKKVMIEGNLDSYFKDDNLITYIVLEKINDNFYNKLGDILSSIEEVETSSFDKLF